MGNNAPRHSETIKQLIVEADEALSAFGDVEQPLGFALEVTQASLLARREELLEEMKAAEMAESDSHLTVVLDGDPVDDHFVDSALLLAALQKIQSLWDAIVGSKALNPEQAHYKMKFGAFAASSFAIPAKIEGPEGTADSADLFGDTNFKSDNASTRLTNVMRDLFSADTPDDTLKGYIKDPKLKECYNDLIGLLEKNGATIGVRTRRAPYIAKLGKGHIQKRLDYLLDYGAISITGILTMGNITARAFTIESDGMTYSGTMCQEATLALNQILLGSKVRARMSCPAQTHGEKQKKAKKKCTMLSIALEQPQRSDFLPGTPGVFLRLPSLEASSQDDHAKLLPCAQQDKK